MITDHMTGSDVRAQGHTWSLPNLLTYGRILLVPVMVLCFYLPAPASHWTALVIFIVAGITDYFDGVLARRWEQQSAIGKMLDPIADKILVAAALLMLAAIGTIGGVSLIAAVIILCREVFVSGLREFLAAYRISVPVTQLAKWKTTIQMIAIGFLIAGPAADAYIPGVTLMGIVLLWMSAILTLYTGWEYLRAGFRHARET